MAIPQGLLEARWANLTPPRGTSGTRDGVDCRIRMLVLLVALAVVLAAIVPDFELASLSARPLQRVQTQISFAHLPNPPPALQPTLLGAGSSAVSTSRVHNCIIELNCSRLC